MPEIRASLAMLRMQASCRTARGGAPWPRARAMVAPERQLAGASAGAASGSICLAQYSSTLLGSPGAMATCKPS